MKIIKIIAVAAGLTGLTLACVAQEEDADPTVFTYATYYYCNTSLESGADEIIAAGADRMNGFVEDGTISAWGWLAHHTGGQWRRIFYYQAESMDALMDAYVATQGDDEEDDADAEDDGPSLAQICPRHDDYIWQAENGSQTEERGAAGFSVYMICDSNREERADEIVDEYVAPIMNGLVEEGKLSSWGWSSHSVGGRFRRLHTMTAPDMKTLLKGREDAIAGIYAEGSELGGEFAEICDQHVDYMWNIQHESN
jgi:hypothetical protein